MRLKTIILIVIILFVFVYAKKDVQNITGKVVKELNSLKWDNTKITDKISENTEKLHEINLTNTTTNIKRYYNKTIEIIKKNS